MINKSNLRKVIFTLIIITIILNTSSVAFADNNLKNNNFVDEKQNFNGYIIEFNEQSIVSYKTSLKNRIKNRFSIIAEDAVDLIFNQNIKNYKNKLLNLHLKAKEDILNIIGKDISDNDIFSNEFTTVFNGISIHDIPEEYVNSIEKLPYVKKIFTNQKITISLDESVPLINADDIWIKKDTFGRNITGKNITIAILDTGVNYNHPDLKDNFISEGSYDYVNDDSDPMDDLGHGTHVAGIIVGKGNASNYRYVGVAPDAKFYSFKIISKENIGYFDDYSAAMEKAVELGVDVISLSFGTESPGVPTDSFCQVADNASDAGVVVVAAAGNLGYSYDSHCITSPGCAQKVICVGASDKNDKIASFSSKGPVEWDGNYMIKPDVVAPGVGIMSTSIDGGYTTKQGTSMSAPHVAGAAALILQANPNYDTNEVKAVLKGTALDLGYDQNIQGAGRIDLFRVFSDDILNIDISNEIFEKQIFTVNITNKTGNPVDVWVLLSVPYHLPKLVYGSSVSLKAPTVIRIQKSYVQGEIKIFKKISIKSIIKNQYDAKKEIIIKNSV